MSFKMLIYHFVLKNFFVLDEKADVDHGFFCSCCCHQIKVRDMSLLFSVIKILNEFTALRQSNEMLTDIV